MSSVGISSLLKEGTKHLSGVEESILRNVEACKALSQITRTSLGPNGMNKMVVTQHDKLFVTSDAATIVKEMDVVHPAAKMLVMASEQQEQECGDATNLVLVFGGELLGHAESLIRTGLHPADIITGYAQAGKKVLELLESPELTVHKLENPRDPAQVAHCLKTVLAAKQHGREDLLAPLVAQACIQILPKTGLTFSVDNVRVAKILGGGVVDTKLVKGFVLTRDVEGTIKHLTNAKVAVFVAGIDMAKPESKGTVLIKNAEQLKNFSLEEEKQMEKIVKEIADSGANVVVSGAAISELAMHFLERYKLMAVKVTSKFNLRRICKATGATALVRLGAPSKEELGFADVINVEEIGSTKVTIFRQDKEESQLSTLIVRASTQNMLDDIERAVDDAANAFRTMLKDGRFVSGAGATELELARRLYSFAEASPGVEQHAIKKFAEALEVVPRTLAENAGLPASDTVAALYAAHSAGKFQEGVDIESGGQIKNAAAAGVLDLLLAKHWALRFACDSVITILRVDQIIMAKPAGGPKPRGARAADADDDAPDLD